MDTALIKIDAATQYLTEVRSLEEVVEFRNRVAAAHQYAVARGAKDAAEIAKEIQLRAERRAGEFLAQEIPHDGGRPEKPSQTVTVNNDVKLSDLGIERMQSSRWQSIASIPEPEFERYIAERRADGKELTQTGLLQVAARLKVPEPAITPPFPEKRYRCIVIDPPWPVMKIEREERPNQGIELDYPTMSLEEIAALPVPDLADLAGCHLYVWVTQKYLPAGLKMVEDWGFKYQCLLTWVKNVGFTPYSWMYDTEHIIFAHKGNLPLGRLGLRLSFNAPVQGHSVKPDVFYEERVKPVSSEPRLEMFARKQREGFEVWGNEV